MIAEDERYGLPSASGMDAEFRCLGRRALVAKVAPQAENEFAKRGTKIHLYLAGELKLDDLPPSDRYTATAIQAEEARLVEHHGFMGSTRISERRLWVLDDGMTKLYSSKVDAAYVLGKRALVIDYKTGFSTPLPLPKNWQIKTQVACISFTYGVNEIIGALIHPHSPDSLSQSMVFPQDKIDGILADIPGYLVAMTEDAPRTPNAISCQYCPAKTNCPEYQTAISAVLPLDGKIVRAPYETMTPEERGNRLRLFKMAEKVMDEERDFYKVCLSNDKSSVGGWRLVTGSNRVIKNPVAAFEKIVAALGDARARTCMDISLSALEAVLAESKIAKKDIPDKVAEILGECLTKKAKQPSLKEI